MFQNQGTRGFPQKKIFALTGFEPRWDKQSFSLLLPSSIKQTNKQKKPTESFRDYPMFLSLSITYTHFNFNW